MPVSAMPSAPPEGVPPPLIPLPGIVEVVVPSPSAPSPSPRGEPSPSVPPVPASPSVPPVPASPSGAEVAGDSPSGASVVSVVDEPSSVVAVVEVVVPSAAAESPSSPRSPGWMTATATPTLKMTPAAVRISFSGSFRGRTSEDASGRRESNPHNQLGRLGL